LPEARPTAFHLHQGGALAPAVPQVEQAARGYRFDPRDPVPTIGGAIASGAPLMAAGAFDQLEQAERADVLVFQNQPLDEALEVTGPVRARLWGASSALDTDFTIKLLDVYPPSADYPHGCAVNLTHGILRMRFRDSFEQPVPMEPDAVYQIEIQAFPTSNLFAAGHRVRVDISSSNFPHFDINPNSGAPAAEPSTPVVAENRVWCDRTRPSHVLLLRAEQVVASNTVCMLTRDNPLARHPVLTPQLLRGEPLVLLGLGSISRTEIEAAFARAEVRPDVRLETHTVGSACALAARGLGVALVNALLAGSYIRPGTTVCEFEPALTHQYAFVTSSLSAPTRLTAAFLDHTSHFSRAAA
jgi:hypothetical protein